MKKLFWAIPGILLGFQLSAAAQVEAVPAGTQVTVRTNDPIDARDANGRIFTGVVDQDVFDRDGYVAIPRGAPVELIARRIGPNDMVLDLESVDVFGHRYAVEATQPDIRGEREREGVGENRRTGQYVGGGAIIGSIIGAIAGGGKGAAIGAAAGAAAGAGAEMSTRGAVIHVPPESLLTFRLERPIHVMEGQDSGYYRDGVHYHREPYRQ